MFFGYSMKEVKNIENMEKYDAVFFRRSRVYGTGGFVAGLESWQYVPGRRQLLFAAGRLCQKQAPVAGEGGNGCGCGDSGGAFGRTAGKPGLQCVGLPFHAPEFSGTGVPALYTALASGKCGWYAPVQERGEGTAETHRSGQLCSMACFSRWARRCMGAASTLVTLRS